METDFTWTLEKNRLCIKGRIDSNTADAFEEALQSAIAAAPLLQIDCSSVPYISSAGLRVLMVAIKAMKKNNKQLTLTQVTADVYHILQLSGFTSILQVQKAYE